MALTKYDETFLGILKEKGHLLPFLDTVFGFLYRCTDFYRIQKDDSDKLGFPPGMAEKCVLKVMRKWELLARQDEDFFNTKRMGCEGDVPPPITEEEVVSDCVQPPPKTQSQVTCRDPPEKSVKSDEEISKRDGVPEPAPDDCYNGQVFDNYQWTQSITDLDVKVPVNKHITKAKDVRVNVTATNLSVSVKEGNEWKVLMEGELPWRNNKEESLWSLEPAKHIQIHLEKSQERWWDCLLTTETKLDLSKIDCSRPMDDLAQEEQMKIQELIWNQERKQQGLPTSDQLATEKILKEAWNKEGSPFLGTEYDPTLINFDGSGELPKFGKPA